MSVAVKSPFIIIGPIVNYLLTTLLWLSVSIGSGLLVAWYFIDFSYEKLELNPVIYTPLEKPVISVMHCEDSINDILQKRTVNFKTGSARLAQQGNQVVQQIAELLIPCPNASITINGHTDNVGSAQKNMRLSIRRAESVAQALIQMGFGAKRFKINGAGESQPIADNNTAEGRYKNRRIEVRLHEYNC